MSLIDYSSQPPRSVWLIGLVVLIAALAIPYSGSSQVLPFRTYSIEEGLSESVVYEVVQDSRDFIWIGTNYGLNRFDGISFRQYHQEEGLRGNSVLGIYEDNQKRLWVGTDDGINLMKKDTLVTPPSLDRLNGIQVNDIYQDEQGRFWFATRGEGVWRWNEKQNTLKQISVNEGLVGNRVRAVAQQREGEIWFATRRGLSRFAVGQIENYTTAEGLPNSMIRDILFDEGGRLLIASRGGLSIFHKGEFRNFTEQDGLISNRIRSLALDASGGLWLGTEEGLSFFSNGQFENYRVSDGLPNEILYATMVDREGNLWMGSYGGGLVRLTGRYYRNFTMDQGLPNEVVTSFTEDKDGNVWISTYGGGVIRYDGQEMEILDHHDGLVDDKVYALKKDRQDRIWIGTRWGISIYDEGRFTNYGEEQIPHRKVRAIYQDQADDGVYWIGTYGGGLLRFEDGRFQQITTEDGLPHNIVIDIAGGDNGGLWLATYGGLSRYKDGTFTSYTAADGLPANGVLDIDRGADGRLWISTFEGIAYLKDNEFTTITGEQALPASLCYFIKEDRNGSVWIGTNKGVIRFRPHEYEQADSDTERVKAFKLINKSQGLVTDEMNVGAVLESAKGALWFGTVSGASQLLADRKKPVPVHPKIHINDLRVAEEKVELEKELTFESDKNSLRFDFIGINYQAPELVEYQYRLKNGEERWFHTSERRVRYTALSPGKYTFQVKARNADGLWSEEVASVRFAIQPPYWQTWWFLIFVVLLVMGIVYFIYHYFRIKRQMEMERMRVRIASDLHDDVGSALTEIALQSDFLQAYQELDPEELKDTLRQIGSQSRKIVSSLDDIVWSIDARNDTVGDLTDRMQDYAYHVLNSKKMDLQFHFGTLDMDQKMSVETRENIYLIYKEAINNVAKHSDATKVEVYLSKKNDTLSLHVIDNGTTSKGKRKSGQGLRNMKLRARRLQAELDIDRTDGYSINVTEI